MPRSIPCPACSARLTVPDKLPDHVKSVRCPKCKTSMSVVKKTTKMDVKASAETKVQSALPKPQAPASAAVPAPHSPVPTPHHEAPSPGLLPDLDDVGLVGETPSMPTTPALPAAPRPDTIHAGQADTPNHGLLPDLDDVGLVGEAEEPIPLAPQPSPAPIIEPLDEIVPTQAADDELVEVVPAVAALEEDLVEVEAADADEELVAVEAAEAEVLDDLVEVEPVDGAVDDLEVVDNLEEVEEAEEEPDRDREPLPGLLGYDEFLLKPQAGLVNLHYDILDYDKKKSLGQAKEERGVAGLLFGRKAANLSLYDDMRDRLLCTLHRPMSLFKSRVEIFDHKERPLGTIAFRMVQFLGGTIYDWDGREWATFKGKWGATPALHVLDDRGKRLGKFTLETFKTKKMVVRFFTKGMSWYLKIGKRLRYDADGKLLLLASVVAYDMVRISMDRPGITMG